MKTILATTIAFATLTTAPAYGQTETQFAMELGEFRGYAQCAALNHGVRTSDEMTEALLYLEIPTYELSINKFTEWKRAGRNDLINAMIQSQVLYSLENCPVLFRRYMEENN